MSASRSPSLRRPLCSPPFTIPYLQPSLLLPMYTPPNRIPDVAFTFSPCLISPPRCLIASTFSGVVAMTTTLCAGFPERSGQLNGVVAMTEGIGKMAGPAIAAPVFAWAIARMPGSTIPDGAQLVFIGFGAVFVGLALLGTLLPHEMDSVAFAMSCEARQRSHQTVEQSHP